MYQAYLKNGGVYSNKNWAILDLFVQCNYDLVEFITKDSIVLVDFRIKNKGR